MIEMKNLNRKPKRGDIVFSTMSDKYGICHGALFLEIEKKQKAWIYYFEPVASPYTTFEIAESSSTSDTTEFFL